MKYLYINLEDGTVTQSMFPPTEEQVRDSIEAVLIILRCNGTAERLDAIDEHDLDSWGEIDGIYVNRFGSTSS